MSKPRDDILLMSILIGITLILLFLDIHQWKPLDVDSPDNIKFDDTTKTLNLSSLTLKQKIAQMVITGGYAKNMRNLQNMFIGGVYFGAKKNKEDYISIISKFQKDAIVPFFVTADLEGFRNPFENFREFPTFSNIVTIEEAYLTGYEEGKLMNELGFNLNFAPVVDLKDYIWRSRAFSGTPEEISQKARMYMKGLKEKGVMATAKHYPGKTLHGKDPHTDVSLSTVEKNDLLPFIENMPYADAIMVSHLVVNGLVDSGGKPSTVSSEVISGLKSEFTGLVITDEISLLSLDDFYDDKNRMYVDLFKAGNDMVLFFEKDIKKLYNMVEIVEKAVLDGEIPEEKIDDSVVKILKAKGIKVIR